MRAKSVWRFGRGLCPLRAASLADQSAVRCVYPATFFFTRAFSEPLTQPQVFSCTNAVSSLIWECNRLAHLLQFTLDTLWNALLDMSRKSGLFGIEVVSVARFYLRTWGQSFLFTWLFAHYYFGGRSLALFQARPGTHATTLHKCLSNIVNTCNVIVGVYRNAGDQPTFFCWICAQCGRRFAAHPIDVSLINLVQSLGWFSCKSWATRGGHCLTPKVCLINIWVIWFEMPSRIVGVICGV